MRSKAELFQEVFGVQTSNEAYDLYSKQGSDAEQPLSNFTKLTLPYEAPSHPVIRIPTVEEIHVAFKNNMIGSRYDRHPVCRIGNTLVKAGSDKTMVQEAEDLLWLQQNSKVRVPKLYAVFSKAGDDNPPYFLVMEFIEGTTILADTWVKFSDAQRENITSGITEQLRLLRDIPSEGCYRRVNGQGFHLLESFVKTGRGAGRGPFQTHDELLSAMYDAAELRTSFRCNAVEICKDNCASYDAEQLQVLSQFKTVLGNCDGREPKFTHTDLFTQNIMVRPLDGDFQSASKYEVIFIDWSGCGWFPAWMQMLRFGLASRMLFVHEAHLRPIYDNAEALFNERVAHDAKEDYTEAVEFWKRAVKFCGLRVNW